MLATRSLIAADPPVHGPMRSLVNRGFTPRRIAALEPRVREIARAALDAVAARASSTWSPSFAIPLPVTVIAELLGVEPERTADFKRWSDCVISGATGAPRAAAAETILAAFSRAERLRDRRHRSAPRAAAGRPDLDA